MKAHGLFLAFVLLVCAAARAEQPALDLIPAPAHFELKSGSFTVQDGTRIVFRRDPRIERVARYFADLVGRTRRTRLELQAGVRSQRAGAIHFLLDGSGEGPEGYRLEVRPDRVLVRANDPRGLFYGAVSLWQLMTTSDQPALRAVTIEDWPGFQWRGLMLDVARHYMPPEKIRQLLDAMALHKLNRFHWHLTDDQGWRLEIRKYPRLTEVGAWRGPARYGGFYTQEEVREIVQYAAERFITVVPEIEMPGHAQAAIAAYPQLGTEGPAPAVSMDWGIHTYLFNVEESTFRFLEDVLSEVMALFPGPYIHVGGDEAVKDRWRASPRVQERMRELGVPDETALQGYFVRRIEEFLAAHGRKLIGWDEILEGGLPPRSTVMSWRGAAGGLEAARSGHDVVMAPAPDLYLDYLQSDSPDEPPGRPRYVTLADIYRFEVLPAELEAAHTPHILGAQVNVWTEHMRTPERVMHAVFPRLAAFSEVTWSPQKRDWDAFVARLPSQFLRYRKLGITPADSAFQVRVDATRGSDPTQVRVTLRNQIGRGEIRYELDGREPTAQSPRYEAPLSLKLPATVTAATFLNGVRMSDPRTQQIDAVSLLRRTDDDLASCSNKLPLRLEDDTPANGDERAVLHVDILDPCWIYRDADLARADRIQVAVARLPFNFQVGEDVKRIPLRTPATAEGELEIRLGSCDGERIAVVLLASVARSERVTALPAVPIAPRPGTHDLCFFFTRHAVDPIWAIDWVQLFEREGS
ncbi:MAG TPA: family 20 glycosylhydrolase [Steroidobacteraceae bacterium]